ncbi:MAG: M28 family peptidase [Planctomycetia bacterium]|nr:M28 family peptidase [Planctomycetia bacterium]
MLLHASIRAFRACLSSRAWTGAWVVWLSLIATGGADEPVGFSGARAFRHLETIAALGPRPSGSPGMEKQRDLLVAHFQAFNAAGARVSRQAFQIRDRRTGQPVRMENLIVEWHPDRKERVLLGAHYDTRPYPDRDPVDPRGVFLGVNDGGSGVAALMELAAAMPGLPGPVGVDFVFFDAEEYVFSPRDPYCLGSNFFARQYAAAQQAGGGHRYRCGVILDMVADRDLEIFQEQHSASWPDTRPVVESLWGVAARLGVRQFVPRPKYTVEDDHVPLRMIGRIPTCDVIDFDYPQWHTTSDTLEHCSGESLEAVGSVVLAWLRGLE